MPPVTFAPKQEKNTQDVVVSMLLDRSGSMYTIKEATVQAINSFVAAQKALVGFPIRFSLTLFDEVNGKLSLETIFDLKPVQDVQALTDFTTRGNTPLYDAIATTASSLQNYLNDAYTKPRVLFVIVTDGHENASRENTAENVRKIIDMKTAQGWEFVYLGANQDAVLEGAKIGITRGNTQTFVASASGVRGMSSSLNVGTQNYTQNADYKAGNFFSQSV